MSVRVEFRWPEDLVERIDAVSGDVSRAMWVRRAVEAALGGSGTLTTNGAATTRGTPVRLSEPAEQLRRGPLVDEIVREHPEVVGRESRVPLKSRAHAPSCRCPVCS